jgi:PAS domain S-box-containing protein
MNTREVGTSERSLQTVLLVEDDMIIGMSESLSLRKEGYSVIRAEDGMAAIQAVRLANSDIDLVLMDVDLGEGMDGTRAAQEILKEYDLPILFLSCHTEKDIVEKTEMITSYGYAVKNAGMAVLSASMKTAFKLHDAHRQLRAKNRELEASNAALNESALKLQIANEELYSANEELRVTNDELSESEDNLVAMNERFVFVQRAGDFAIWDWDIMRNELVWDDRTYDLYGIRKEDFSGAYEAWLSVLHPDDAASCDEESRLARLGVKPYDTQFRIIKPDGAVRVIRALGTITHDESGKPKRMIGTNVDITDRVRSREDLKKALAEKEILFKELQHRVKNNFRLVSSLLMIESDKVGDEGTRIVLDDARSRIDAISEIYEHLYRSAEIGMLDLRSFVPELAGSLRDAYAAGAEPIRIETRVDEILMDLKLAVPFSLILNELLTNAFKHAYPVGKGGEIRVSVARIGDEATLRVADDGRGIPKGVDPLSTDSMGLMLVRMLAEQIHASLDFASGERGTNVSLRFEIPRAERGQS